MGILITGGAGFIGQNLIRKLQKESIKKIIIYDNFSLSNKSLLPNNVKIIEGSVEEKEKLLESCKKVDTIIHLAAHTRVLESIENPTKTFISNIQGTFNIFECCRINKIKKLIIASTGGAIIGNYSNPPISENIYPKPISPYGASKLFAEGFSSAYSESYDISIMCLRFSNVYGPFSLFKDSVVSRFMKQILRKEKIFIYGDGRQTRDFIFSDDIADGIFKTLNSNIKNEVIQLASGIPLSINNLIKKLRNICGNEYPFFVEKVKSKKGEVKNTWADISKSKKYIKFEPKTNIDEGLKVTWEYLKKNYVHT